MSATTEEKDKAIEKPSVADARHPLEEILNLESEFPKTILLQGAWGVGKTCLWRQVIEEVDPAESPIYVSLFGVSSIADIKLSLVLDQAATHMRDKGDSEDADTGLMARLLGWLSSNKNLANLTSAAAASADVSVSGSLVADLAFRGFKNHVVCLDDLERKSEALQIGEVLGLIESLREYKNCKVICIANTESLGDSDRKALLKFKERVFDLAVYLDPPVSYGLKYIAAVTEGNSDISDLIPERLEQLDLNNIRVINRAISLYNSFCETFPDCSADVRSRALHSLLLLAAAENIGPPKYPTIGFLRSFNVFADLADIEDPSDWNALLRNYEWWVPDEVDQELFYFVENGVIRQESMREAIAEIDASGNRALVESEMQRSWRAFHDSFADDGDKVVEKIRKTTSKHAAYISAVSVDAAIRLLRDYGRPDDADELIREFVSRNRDNPEAIDLARIPFSSDIKDQEFRRTLIEESANAEGVLGPPKVIERALNRERYRDEDFPVLATMTVSNWRDLFVEFDGKRIQDLLQMIQKLSSSAEVDEHARIAYDRAVEAISDLCNKSIIRRLRLDRWGMADLATKSKKASK